MNKIFNYQALAKVEKKKIFFDFQFSIFNKLKFLLKRPRVIVITGNSRQTAKEAIFQLLKPYFKMEKDSNPPKDGSSRFAGSPRVPTTLPPKGRAPILILELEEEKVKDLTFYLKNSKKAVLVITPGVKEMASFAKKLPPKTNLIFNFDFDNEIIRELKDMTGLNTLTFGFQEGADLRVTDINLNQETNFKINYQGNIVPVWLGGILGKEQIYDTLAAASCGTILDLNLVQISQALKNYYSLPEKRTTN